MNYFALLLVTLLAVGQLADSAVESPALVPAAQVLALQRQALHGKTYLAIGDSLSVGSYAPSADRTFPSRVAAQLGMNLVLMARSGAKAAWALPQLEAARGAGATLVTVELGTNDAGFHTPPADFARQYETILKAVSGPGTRVLCVGSWLPAADFDAMIQQICERHGGSFVSLDGFYDVAGFHAQDDAPTFRGRADWFHPGDAGHAAIAAAVLTSLKGRFWPETSTVDGPVNWRGSRAE